MSLQPTPTPQAQVRHRMRFDFSCRSTQLRAVTLTAKLAGIQTSMLQDRLEQGHKVGEVTCSALLQSAQAPHISRKLRLVLQIGDTYELSIDIKSTK